MRIFSENADQRLWWRSPGFIPVPSIFQRSGQVVDAEDFSERMAGLQKMRVALVILLSQENSRLLSRRQQVAGKEIEVMCAERDLEQGENFSADQQALEALYLENRQAQQALAEAEQEISRMEQLMVRIDADIAALCQA